MLDDFRALEMIEDGRKKEVRGAQDKGWKNEMSAFAKAIRAGGQPPIPYGQLIGVTRAAFAAVESIRLDGSVPVEIT